MTASSMIKGVGIGLALGGTAAVIGASMFTPSLRKQTKKNALKAMKTMNNVMDTVNSMMK